MNQQKCKFKGLHFLSDTVKSNNNNKKKTRKIDVSKLKSNERWNVLLKYLLLECSKCHLETQQRHFDVEPIAQDAQFWS